MLVENININMNIDKIQKEINQLFGKYNIPETGFWGFWDTILNYPTIPSLI